MAELMKTCKSKVMLSINDHEDMRATFDGLNIATTKIKYSVGNSGSGRDEKQELIITNY
ncbi:adenine modification methytransferase [Acinetobacter baumannii]|nr:adenine modification methytransferase [Acinetobacter baumannii]